MRVRIEWYRGSDKLASLDYQDHGIEIEREASEGLERHAANRVKVLDLDRDS